MQGVHGTVLGVYYPGDTWESVVSVCVRVFQGVHGTVLSVCVIHEIHGTVLSVCVSSRGYVGQ